MQPLAQTRMDRADTKPVRTRRTEIVIVSSDDGFLLQLGPVLGDRYRTRTVDHPDKIHSVTEARRWLAIIDAASLPDAPATVARMERQYPQAEIFVVTDAPEQWSSALSRGVVIDTFARDQLTSPELLAALSAAETRLLREAGSAASPDPPPAAGPTSGAPTRRLRTALPLLGLLLAGIAAGAWWLLRTPGNPAALTGSANLPNPAAAKPGTVPAPTRPQSVLELLSAARVAFRDQKLLLPRPDTEPRGDSALELYAQALVQEPGNDEALDGVRRLFAVAKARIQSDLAVGKLDDAARLVALFEATGTGVQTGEIEAEIAAARPKWLAQQAQVNIAAGDFVTAQQLIEQLSATGADRNSIERLHGAIDAKKLELQLASMAASVKAAIDSGALLEPAADNARTRLQAMRAVTRNHPLTLAAQRDVQAALIARAQDASRKEQFDLMQRYLGAASDIGASAEVADARRRLQGEMEQAAQRAALAAAAAKAKEAPSGAAGASNTGFSAANARAAPQIINAHPAAPLHVVFPSWAEDNHVAGYVILEFTLHPNGSASNPTVVESKPARTFDRAATDAVLSGRFDTQGLVDGQPLRARIRLTFKPT